MFCTKCGKKLNDGDRFCTNCGAQTTQGDDNVGSGIVAADGRGAQENSAQSAFEQVPTHHPLPSEPREEQPGNRADHASKGRRTLLYVISAIAITILVGVGVLAAIQNASESFQSEEAPQVLEEVVAEDTLSDSEVAAEDDAEQSEADSENDALKPTYQSGCFQIFLPSDVADRAAFEAHNNTVSIKDVPTGVVIAVLNPSGEALIAEYARRCYTLGDVYVAGHFEEAQLSFPYIGADDKTVHWGSKEPRELAIEKLWGMTCEGLIEGIRLSTGSDYISAEAVMGGDDGAKAESAQAPSEQPTSAVEAVPAEPFWGIWIGASKEKEEMDALGQRIHDDGIGEGVVVMTTDWSNLNSEPWWVLSVGHYASKEEANAALPAVQQAGWPSAYVKYSGDKIG